jgi:bifunctional non-homologous end joining protein LigD
MKTKKISSLLPEELLKKVKKIPQPDFIPPMLATLTQDYFSSKEWFYEHKFDGVRCLAFKKNGRVRLLSRNDKSMNDEYPELASALEKQKADNFIIDGEIIALDKKGVSDFQLLQSRMNLRNSVEVKKQQAETPILYRIFDLLYVDGYDIEKLPLYARKEILKKLLSYNKVLTYTEHIVGNGIALFKKACALKWEGVIAKRSDSIYIGKRSRDWLKFKCSASQELIIVGYTDPQGSRKYFGALLVGYYDKGTLCYAGKVGTGYSHEVIEMLGKKLKKLEIKKSLLHDYDGQIRGVHWVKPVLVADFQFAQWTQGGKLRVGRYKGLREDKKARDVVRETPR